MSFSGMTARGIVGERNSDTSVSVSPNSAISAGQLLIVKVVADNISTVTGDSNDHTVTDSQSNTYTKAFETTQSDGAAADGTTTSVWFSVLTTGLTLALGEITCTFSSAVLSKVIGITEVTITESAVAVEAFAVDPDTPDNEVSLAGLTNQEYLLIGVAGCENENSSFTSDPDYTQLMVAISSTTGSVTTNVALSADGRIATLNGDTWSPSNLGPGDRTVTLVAIYEEAVGAALLKVHNETVESVENDVRKGELFRVEKEGEVVGPPVGFVDLDGTDDFIKATDAELPDLSSTTTIELVGIFHTDVSVATRDIDLITKWHSQDLHIQLYLATAGGLVFRFSSDGTTIQDSLMGSNMSWDVGQVYWVRCVFDLNAGSITFYRSTDHSRTPLADVTWEQIGTDTTTGGATLSNTVGAWNLGNAEDAGAGHTVRDLNGGFYAAWIFDAGVLVSNPDFRDLSDTDWSVGSGDDAQGVNWTFEGNAVWTEPEDTREAFFVLGISRLQDETLQISDSDIRILTPSGEAIIKVEDETSNLSETTLSLLNLIRLVNEVVDISEANQRVLALVRIQGETVEITDSVIRALGLVRQIDESENLLEDEITVLDLVRLIANIANLNEDDLSIRGIFRVQDEIIQITEANQHLLGRVRLEDEVIQITDTQLRFLDLVRQVNEVVQIVDTQLQFRDLVRLENEVIDLSEEDLRFQALIRIENEVIQISEEDLGLLNLLRILTESSDLLEADIHIVTLAGAAIVKVQGESIQVSEADLTHQDLLRLIPETLAPGESILRLRALTREQAETASLPEVVIRALDLLKRQEETASLIEIPSFVRGLPARIINEGVQMVESSLRFAAVAITGVLRKWRDFTKGKRSYSTSDREYSNKDRDYD